MADEVDYVYRAFEINMRMEHGERYVMRLMLCNGRMRAFVDGSETYDSDSSVPVTSYEEPHLAVRYDVAVFEHVRIGTVP